MASRGTLDVAGCIHFSREELEGATDNFNEKPVHRGGCKIGEGRFGPVYKGILKYMEVAIKILNTAAIPKVEGKTHRCIIFHFIFDQDKKGQELFAQQFDTELRVLTKYVTHVCRITS